MKLLFLSFFFLMIEFSAISQGTNDIARIAKSHQLLWFKGNWSSANTFTIEKDSTQRNGVTLTVSPEGKIVLHSADIDDWDKWVDADLKKVDDWEKQLNAPANNIDLTTHHLNLTQLADVANLKKEYESLKIDKKQDLLNSGESEGERMSKLLAADCEKMKPAYEEVMAHYHAHRHDKDASLQNPDPPQLDYECYACDSLSRKNKDTIVANYVKNFFKPESKYIHEGLGIIRQMALYGIDQQSGVSEDFIGLFDINKKDPSKSGPCSYIDLEELNTAVYDIANHAYRRAAKLLYDNRRNYKAADAVIKTYLTGCRDWQMMGGKDDFNTDAGDLINLVQQNFDFYYGKLKQNDWSQIGNIPYLLSLLREEQLLGDNSDDFNEILTKLTSIINNFQLSVEMDVKAGGNGGYTIAHLKGKCNIIPDFQRDSDQCYRWVIADDNAKDIYGFRKTKPQQQIDCQIIDNEIVAPGTRPVYIGTKKYVTNLQRLHMDFCKPGNDTILLTGFYSNPDGDGIWQFPQNIKQNLSINQSDQYFRNIETMEILALSGKAQSAAGKMKTQANQLEAQMQALSKKMDASNDKMVYYTQMMEMAQKMKNLTSNINVAPILYIDFQLPVHNNSPVLVNNRYDAKQINPQISEALVYGYYTVQVENKANEGK